MYFGNLQAFSRMPINSVQYQNLRSLTDTGRVELGPLNILLGRNGSGKSTFLRTFPLFRQSIRTPTTGPVLWYGSLVDLGSFGEAVHSGDESIVLHFGFNLDRSIAHRPMFRRLAGRLIQDLDVQVSLELVYHERTDATVAHRCQLSFEGASIDLGFEGRSISYFVVNGRDILEEGGEYKVRQGRGLLPSIYPPRETDGRALYSIWGQEIGLEKTLLTLLSNVFHGRTQRGTRLKVIRKLGVGSPERMHQNLRQAHSDYWQRQVDRLSKSRLSKVRDLTLALQTPSLLSLLDAEVIESFADVSYTNPLRAAAERYYRRQNLAVGEVDPQGTNLAVFLRSLSPGEREQFNSWTQEHLGFAASTSVDGGHVSIEIEEEGGRFNLADMGFGFSQILPVVTQVWARVYRPQRRQDLYNASKRAPVVLAIEQPELHLHPALQARFGDLLISVIAAARDAGVRPIILVETHSEALVGRIGNRVAVGHDVSPDDVKVLLFEGDRDRKHVVQQTEFDSRGLLKNWPLGFFDPDPIRIKSAPE